jgi:electron transfer flavoprotein beta subunit
MIAGILGYNFLNSCTSLTVDGTTATAVREIDGEKKPFQLHYHIRSKKD